jgi:hypothetical protein
MMTLLFVPFMSGGTIDPPVDSTTGIAAIQMAVLSSGSWS